MKHVDMLAHFPTIREFIGSLPQSLLPKERPFGYVVRISKYGVVDLTLQDPKGFVSTTTGAKVHNGRLWISSLKGPLSYI